MKALVALTVSCAAVAAAATAAPQCAGCTVLSDTKCPDTAYRRADVKSWQDCCNECSADAQCNAWAFAPSDQGNACHLKHNVTSTHGAKGFTCGIFPGGGPTPPQPAPTPPPSPLPPTPPPTPADPSAPRPNFLFILQDGKCTGSRAFMRVSVLRSATSSPRVRLCFLLCTCSLCARSGTRAPSPAPTLL